MLSLSHTAVVLKCSVLFFFFNDVDLHSPVSLPKLTLILDPDVLVSLLNLFCSSSFFFFASSLRFSDAFFSFLVHYYQVLQNKGCSNSRVKQASKTNYIFYFMLLSPAYLPSLYSFFFCFSSLQK